MELFDRDEKATQLKVKFDALRRDYLAKEEKRDQQFEKKPSQPSKPRP